jgi:hypothetical protein
MRFRNNRVKHKFEYSSECCENHWRVLNIEEHDLSFEKTSLAVLCRWREREDLSHGNALLLSGKDGNVVWTRDYFMMESALIWVILYRLLIIGLITELAMMRQTYSISSCKKRH